MNICRPLGSFVKASQCRDLNPKSREVQKNVDYRTPASHNKCTTIMIMKRKKNAWIATRATRSRKKICVGAEKENQPEPARSIMYLRPLLLARLPPNRHIAPEKLPSNLRSAVDGSSLSVHASL